MVLVFWGFWFCCFGLVLCFWCLVGVFCVEKLRNLDLYLFGAVTFVTFVTFCYIYIDSRGSRGLCLYGFLGVVALGNPSKH